MRVEKTILLALVIFLSVGISANATSVTFTFDTTTINGTTITGLSSGANAAAIQTYMNAVLTASGCAGCTVSVLVSGSAIGAVADQTYNGDMHATGPGTASQSLTLGDSNGASGSNTNSAVNGTSDTFISNTNDSSGTVSQQITLKFSGISGLSVNSFDYEIFPDGTCTQLNSASCGGTGGTTPSGFKNQPDLIFQAGNGTTGSGDATVSTIYGVTPGTTNGNETHSPLSGSSSAELAPQAIGTWSGAITGDTELDFVDWPATIGIDNLSISGTNIVHSNVNPSVPEPASIALLGTLVALLTKKLRRA